jgi:hypothetical protein
MDRMVRLGLGCAATECGATGCVLLALAACMLSATSAYAAGPMLTRLAADVEAAAALERHRVLVLGTDGALSTIDYRTGAREPWQCSWTPRGAGWDAPDAPVSLLATPDGRHVVLYFDVDHNPDTYVLGLVVCDAHGRSARLIANLDAGDAWGSQPQFSADSRYFICYELAPFGTDPDDGPDDAPRIDGYDFVARRHVELPGFYAADGDDASPYGDYRHGIDPDTRDDAYYRLHGNRWVMAGRSGEDSIYGHWVAPHLRRLESGDVERVDGERWAAPPGDWVVYTYLPDRRCFFSRDGGANIELGSINWRTGAVTRHVPCPALKLLATPWRELDAYEVDWLRLPDSSGAVVKDAYGGLWLVRI